MPKSKNPIGYYKSKRLVSKDGRIVGVEDILVHPSDGKVVVISKEVAEEMDRKRDGEWAAEYLYRVHHKDELPNVKRYGLAGTTPQEAHDKILAEHPEYRKEWEDMGITRENETWGGDFQGRRLYFVKTPKVPYVGHLKLRVKKDIADEYGGRIEEDKGLPGDFYYDEPYSIPPEHIRVQSGSKWIPITEFEYKEREKKGKWGKEHPFSESTGLPEFINMKENPEYFERAKEQAGEIVFMSPDEYMRQSAYVQKVPLEHTMRIVMPEYVNKYAKMMKGGTKFDIPYLDFKRGEQEGRHRAMAAKKLGYDEIPVLIVDRPKNLKDTVNRIKYGTWAGKKPWEMTKEEYNKYRGVVYHQTSKQNAEKIEQEGFRLDYPLARRGDDRMPDAVFLKPTMADIGVGAMEEADRAQIDAYVKKGNVKEFATTEKLRDYLEQDPQYRELYYQSWLDDRRIAKEMNKLSDEYFHSDRDRLSPEEMKEFEDKYDLLKKQVYIAPTKARERATAYLKEQGVDTVIVKDDVGSYGRRVTTVAALDPKNIKPYLHKQVVREALKRGKDVPDSVLKDYADLYAGKKVKGTWAKEIVYHGGRDMGDEGILKFGMAGRVGSGQDAGAIFVTPSKKYAQQYVNAEGKLYQTKIDLDKEKIFDATNPAHLNKLRAITNDQTVKYIKDSISHGAADWATLSQFTDEINEAGYTGAKFLERPAENITELHDGSFKLEGKPVYSYGLFHELPVKYAPLPLQRSARPYEKVKGHSNTKVGRVR